MEIFVKLIPVLVFLLFNINFILGVVYTQPNERRVERIYLDGLLPAWFWYRVYRFFSLPWSVDPVCRLDGSQRVALCEEIAEIPYYSTTLNIQMEYIDNEFLFQQCSARRLKFRHFRNADVLQSTIFCPSDPYLFISRGDRKNTVFIYLMTSDHKLKLDMYAEGVEVLRNKP